MYQCIYTFNRYIVAKASSYKVGMLIPNRGFIASGVTCI